MSEVPQNGAPPSLEGLRPALRHLEELFTDIWGTQEAPDYGGPRWLEIYRGSAIDETFVCVDFTGSVLHVRRAGREQLTVTYVPGWFSEVVTRALSLREDFSTAYVADLATARPVVFELFVEHAVDAVQEVEVPAPDGGAVAATYSPLPFGYEYEPAHAFAAEPAAQAAKGFAAWIPSSTPIPLAEQVQWSAMRLRLVAAPGVRFTQRRLVPDAVLDDARAVYVPYAGEFTSCTQALQFELERRQDPTSVPGLGARVRPAPLAEVDLVAGSVSSREGAALALELTRPDGVDILVCRPGSTTSVAPWLVELGFQLMRDVVDTTVEWMGGIPREMPLPIRIRVPLDSPDERFAYRIRYLDNSGDAHDEPAEDADRIRLSVVRTPGVTVALDLALSDLGLPDLERTVAYHERVEKHVDDVPLWLHDDNDVYGSPSVLPDRDSTLQDIVTIAYYLGEFVPLPQLEAFYEMRDAASLATYVLYGKDVTGEDMGALDAALTVGGFLIPAIGERVVRNLARAARRLRTVGDDPFARLVHAGEALSDGDVELLETLVDRAAEDAP